jgi:hypothetical protein
MTELLKRALAEIENLPDEAQDAIAARLLEEIADEAACASRFAGTTDEHWSKRAHMAHIDLDEQSSIVLENLFPPDRTA